ncbi:hypothetical protein HWD99_05580 [Microbacterium sp. C5A9]|uniref:hypothetical protein n=1 Tax=Microbacterium sp. C5A9 TaxID=2736663 RepID=UPI001F522C19|nr:hypothetical protein [Microbacterium sp. C5A9]MCI1018088.1 hypothetical protein [Microbacterium sp. C5A9]
MISCDRAAQSALVVIDADASAEDVIAFAESLHGATAVFAEPVSLEARSSHALVLDPEVAPPFSWQIDLNALQSTDLAASLRDTLEAASVPGAVGITRHSGWGFVTVQRIEQFEDVFDTLSQGVFASGATYTLQSMNERLRIVHVPDRTSANAIHEIISIAQDYPDAEVLLESMTSGPQSPTFSVARLTPPQQQELAARLRDSRWAGADVDGYPLEFVLGSIGEQGVTYVSGTFGDVPAG